MLFMTRGKKLTFGAAAAAAALLVVGLGAAGAVAASRVLSPDDERKAVIDDAAAQLGVEPSELSAALEQALKNRIDEAVDAGRLTEEQAERLKEQIEAGEYPFLFGPALGAGHFGGFGMPAFDHADLLEAAASYLGMSADDLREALDDKTLAEIAKERGKSVAGLVAALVAAEEKRVDEAVADGRITKAQATDITSRLQDRMQALVDGELRAHCDGAHAGLWRGSGFPRGPPATFGDGQRA
jgi:uncharacterized protein YidB (DUF937 family)